jgi:prephenate dehydratase
MAMKVSIQGNKGSFHDIVASKVFSGKYSLLERDSFKEVFADVAEGRAAFGVVAVENSIAGSIHENYDHLLKNELFIVGEVYLRISHQLMVLPGTELDEIKVVMSHPMALLQCEEFLSKHPDWEIIEEPDTAGSAAKIRNNSLHGTAAVASSLAAEIYELDIVASEIETNKENYTRFLIIAREENYPESADKTSIVFTAEDKPGSLSGVLGVFADLNINLTKIESRPIVGKSWRYYFYIDFEAGVQEERAQKAFKLIKPHVNWFRVLGSYKKGTPFKN